MIRRKKSRSKVLKKFISQKLLRESPRTLLVWGTSILFHAALLVVLGDMMIPSCKHFRLHGVQLTNANFQAFVVEEIDGQKLFHVSTLMVDADAPTAGSEMLITADAIVGEPPTVPAPIAGKNSFFGLRAEGKVIVFVVDVSGSMYEKTGLVTRLARVFEQLEQTVWSLAPEQKFNIVLFATKVVPLAAEPISATPENKRRASAWLASDVDCGGTTNMGEALMLALTMKPEMIILLTDGEADNMRSICSQVALLRKRFSPTVRINSVGFYLEPKSAAERLLQDLSQDTKGDYVRLKKGD